MYVSVLRLLVYVPHINGLKTEILYICGLDVMGFIHYNDFPMIDYLTGLIFQLYR